MDRQATGDKPRQDSLIGTRSVLKGLGAGALGLSVGGVLSACSSGLKGAGGSTSSGTITVGFITPLTGALSDFRASDMFVYNTVKALPAYTRGSRSGTRPTRSTS
jgi:hypothetical protein